MSSQKSTSKKWRSTLASTKRPLQDITTRFVLITRLSTSLGFHDPKKCQELTSECYQLVGKEKADVEILDMGCGTGLVGQYLYEDGFRQIVGLDASAGMLKEAE